VQKRLRRTTVNNNTRPPVVSNNLSSKRRRTSKSIPDTFMSKEELLHTITHELPARYLEGVIKIVHPTFDPQTATDDDLEFDINLLDDEVLYQLIKYVNSAIEGQEAAPGAVRRTKDQKLKRNNNAKNAPKERLRKEAPKKRRPAQQRQQPQHRKGRKPTTTFITVGQVNKKAPKMMREIFKCEEVIHVNKTHDNIEDEDEEVDILGI